MTRIRSYTIIEMLVVMLISAMSIVITYTCYSIFSNHYLSYKKNSDVLANYILFDKLVTKDISACSKVVKTQEGMVCEFKQNAVYYEFSPTYVIRRSTIIDTFHIAAFVDPEFKKMDKILSVPGTLIEEMTFEAIYKEEKLFFYYKKNYGADLLMSIEEADKQ